MITQNKALGLYFKGINSYKIGINNRVIVVYNLLIKCQQRASHQQSGL